MHAEKCELPISIPCKACRMTPTDYAEIIHPKVRSASAGAPIPISKNSNGNHCVYSLKQNPRKRTPYCVSGDLIYDVIEAGFQIVELYNIQRMVTIMVFREW